MVVCSSHKLAPVYRPRRPRASPLYRLIERYYPEFERVYDERYERRYGSWRPIVGEAVRRFLRCGDLHFGFARVRCTACRHEMFVPFSCRQRCLCPSCHQKRSLLAADRIARAICAQIPHRQVVLTIPKRLRLYFRFDRRLVGGLARAAWHSVLEIYRGVLQRDDALPGMIAGIQTFGELVHFHPHVHAIVTDGAFAPDGGFVRLPPVDRERLLATWQTKVFELLVAAEKIDQLAVDAMRAWPHSGFSVDHSVYLAPGDAFGLERLAQYILRCPFSLARVVRLTADGSVIYRAEKDHCRRFPGPASADLRGGPRRNFQVCGALDFLAELTQHIPDKGEHLVRYYGWYSHRRRGMRSTRGSGSFSCRAQNEESTVNDDGKKTCLTPSSTSPAGSDTFFPTQRDAPHTETPGKKVSDPLHHHGTGQRAGSLSTWAMLLKRIFEVDPLKCPQCGGAMKIVSFIERRQHEVIARILRHCGFWEGPIRTLASARSPPGKSSEQESDEPRELQLVLDPEYL